MPRQTLELPDDPAVLKSRLELAEQIIVRLATDCKVAEHKQRAAEHKLAEAERKLGAVSGKLRMGTT